jgi:hypothetical protein
MKLFFETSKSGNLDDLVKVFNNLLFLTEGLEPKLIY